MAGLTWTCGWRGDLSAAHDRGWEGQVVTVSYSIISIDTRIF